MILYFCEIILFIYLDVVFAHPRSLLDLIWRESKDFHCFVLIVSVYVTLVNEILVNQINP